MRVLDLFAGACAIAARAARAHSPYDRAAHGKSGTESRTCAAPSRPWSAKPQRAHAQACGQHPELDPRRSFHNKRIGRDTFAEAGPRCLDCRAFAYPVWHSEPCIQGCEHRTACARVLHFAANTRASNVGGSRRLGLSAQKILRNGGNCAVPFPSAGCGLSTKPLSNTRLSRSADPAASSQRPCRTKRTGFLDLSYGRL